MPDMVTISTDHLDHHDLLSLDGLAQIHHHAVEQVSDTFADFAVMRYTCGFVLGLALDTGMQNWTQPEIDQLCNRFELGNSLRDAIRYAVSQQASWICFDRDADSINELPLYRFRKRR